MYKLTIDQRHGYFTVEPKPTLAELQQYYSSVYFQKDQGQYSKSYTSDEMEFFLTDCKVISRLYQLRFGKAVNQETSVLDVGCGEGFQSDYFFKNNIPVICCDFSSSGIDHHHPHLRPYLRQGDIEDSLKRLIMEGRKFSIILLENVLEHVVDPDALIALIKGVMAPDSLLLIKVPNDYSDFQQFLLENKMTKDTWFCPPAHLQYFQFDSLKSFLKGASFNILSCQADFPIELFLVNRHSNYVMLPETGKEAHYSRCKISNFLSSKDIDAFIAWREASANLCFGRGILAFLTL